MQSTPPEIAVGRCAEGGPPAAESASAGSGEARRDCNATPTREIGGRAGPDPTRFGDWEKNGRCIDF
jgi:hypothetical protein